MKITTDCDTLRVTDLHESADLEEDILVHDIRAALTPSHATIEFDLAQLRAIHCGIADALLTVYDELNHAGRQFTWRVVNPPPELRQLFELMRLHHLFEITPPRSPRMILL
jgi:anti-anti-sigma regulatory factor